MKVIIEAESQGEFDEKRPSLIKALAGRPAIEPRRSALTAQNQIMDYFDGRYKAMIDAIKGDINDLLEE